MLLRRCMSSVAGKGRLQSVLVANRGEIACRVMRTARRMGVRTVAVYSEADANAMHVQMANEAHLLGPPPARESYLLADRILELAKATGAQGIHPGYGFLSENANFARKCEERGVVFIGPPASAIEAMGSKSESKNIMERAGVPCVPGYHGEDQSFETLKREAEKIGFPVLIKAVLGGGGKGMRIVHSADEFSDALDGARREAMASFSDDRVLVEKYITRPRHIELQVFGDSHGNAVYFFERDCSVQRRHQKILEEAPAPGLTDEFRQQMGASAVSAAKAVGYVGAGTVEFIFDQDTGDYYFMEMNTRLQVEHPVTEMITGVDLVELQLKIAAGEPLPMTQEDIKYSGHAFEARIYSENPNNNFLPATGSLFHLRTPLDAGMTDGSVRVDSGVREGDEVSMFYDPMIAKLIVHGPDRSEALLKLQQALNNFHVFGLPNNVEFLKSCVKHSAFAQGGVDTNFIQKYFEDLFPRPITDSAVLSKAAVWATCGMVAEETAWRSGHFKHAGDKSSPWSSLEGARFGTPWVRTVEVSIPHQSGDEVTMTDSQVEVTYLGNHQYSMKPSTVDKSLTVEIQDTHAIPSSHPDVQAFHVTAVVDGVLESFKYVSHPRKDKMAIFSGQGHRFDFVRVRANYASSSGAGHSLSAPMPGKVIKILTENGATVKKGQPLLILEAMKMEHTIKAPSDGVIETVNFTVGEMVQEKQVLVSFVE